MTNKVSSKIIADFGRQWTNYTENTGYYASADFLDDLFGPLIDKESIKGRKIADVGAGTGRFVKMFHELGAKHILALEPSSAIDVLKESTSHMENVEYLQTTADRLPADNFDLVFCIGVLQFIPEPVSTLRGIGKALSPNGHLFLWVYGQENNKAYLTLVRPLRLITARLPHPFLAALSSLLLPPANLYSFLCRHLSLPLAEYMRNYFEQLDQYSRKLVIYDQLNPRMARYYQKDELQRLLEESGFNDIQMYHRLGYSWSVLAGHKGTSSAIPPDH